MLCALVSLWPLWAVAAACWFLLKVANVYISYRKRTRSLNS